MSRSARRPAALRAAGARGVRLLPVGPQVSQAVAVGFREEERLAHGKDRWTIVGGQ